LLGNEFLTIYALYQSTLSLPDRNTLASEVKLRDSLQIWISRYDSI